MTAAEPPKHRFDAGLLAALPIALGYLPIAFSFGVAATRSGLSGLEAFGMSALIYAGAAQFLALGLVAAGTPLLVVAATLVAMNLRHLIYAPALLKQLSEAGGNRLIVASDVGQHQMWVAQHWRVPRAAAHLSSGGLGTMGFGLPAAIGAQLARPDACVVCVSGDGSIMMNIQELATLKRYGIPVKIVLLDNSCLGMVRQWQELFFAERYSEVDLSDNPDFAVLARAFGIPAFTVDRADQVPAAIERLLEEDGPLFCHVKIDPRANVWPLVPPGKSNAQMMGCAA